MRPKQGPRAEGEGGSRRLTKLTPADFPRGDVGGVVVVRGLTGCDGERGQPAELYRDDGVGAEFRPAMAYIPTTRPGVRRGPHEHRGQADCFRFVGPPAFGLRLWDNR